jgi:hypothetical protein
MKPSKIRITIEATDGYNIRQARGKWIELPPNSDLQRVANEWMRVIEEGFEKKKGPTNGHD